MERGDKYDGEPECEKGHTLYVKSEWIEEDADGKKARNRLGQIQGFEHITGVYKSGDDCEEVDE